MTSPGRNTSQGHRRSASLRAPAGTTLFDSAHPSKYIYRIRSGTVQLTSASGVVLDDLDAGDLFGEKALLSDWEEKLTATVTSPARLDFYSKRSLGVQMRTDGRFAERVVQALARRLDRSERMIRELATEPVTRRLALLLLRCLPDGHETGFVQLEWNPTNPELARRIGTTRWLVSRVLNRFQRLGWLRRDEGVWIHRQRLRDFLVATQPDV